MYTNEKMIQINALVLLRIAVIAIIAILPTTGAPVQTTTQAEVSWFQFFFFYCTWIMNICDWFFFVFTIFFILSSQMMRIFNRINRKQDNELCILITVYKRIGKIYENYKSRFYCYKQRPNRKCLSPLMRTIYLNE